MSPNASPQNELSILGKFASIVGLLGAALYFTGWIYRWAYFNFFQLEVTTLDLPAESFLLVPLQVFLGNGWAILRSAIAFIFAAIAIHLTLWLVQTITNTVSNKLDRLQNRIFILTTKRKQSWITQPIASLTEFSSLQLDSVKFLRSLVDETIIVAWVLITLFWLSSGQGTADARRDAVNQTSTLPVVTLVTPASRLPLGRPLDDLTSDPSLKGYRIFGDTKVFDQLRGQETTENHRVWRLLIERDGWIYLFPALSSDTPDGYAPPVLAIKESNQGEQLMIFKPAQSN